jgi:metal-responsive CopG/Arc/MetJ family transcriptional regulator
MSRYRGYRRVSITMPTRVLRRINKLAREVELSRSEVITDLCEFCLDDDEVIDKIYPYEDEEEDEED